MQMQMYGQNKDGSWVPFQVDAEGTPAEPVFPIWSYAGATGGITDTADVALVAAGGAGNVNYLTTLQFFNKHATTATEVVVKDGSTVIWRGYAPALGAVVSVTFPKPLRSSNNTALNFACVTNSTATIVNAQGYTTLSVDQALAAVTAGEEIFDDLGNLMTAPDGTTLYLN